MLVVVDIAICSYSIFLVVIGVAWNSFIVMNPMCPHHGTIRVTLLVVFLRSRICLGNHGKILDVGEALRYESK